MIQVSSQQLTSVSTRQRGAGDQGWFCDSATFILPIKSGADSPFAGKRVFSASLYGFALLRDAFSFLIPARPGWLVDVVYLKILF